MFEVGDFLSMKGNQFSFFDMGAMDPVTFANGGAATWTVEKQVAPEPTAPTPKPAAQKIVPVQKAELSNKPACSFDMTKQEMSHFHSNK